MASPFKSIGMRLRSWFMPQKPRTYQRRSRLIVEALEDRVVPSSTYVLGGAANNLTPNSSSWSWDDASGFIGSSTAYRGAIQNSAYFGSSGVVPVSISTANLSSVTSSTLASLNGFISSWWANTDTPAAAVTAITNFFLSGHDLILLDDDSTHDAIAAALGIPTAASTGTVSNDGVPLFTGPFGVASNVTQSGAVGQLSGTQIVSNHGHVGATNQTGQITAAYWNAGDYAPGAGRLLIVADVDMWSTAGSAVYFPTLNSNATFALNGTAFIVTPLAPKVTAPANQSGTEGAAHSFSLGTFSDSSNGPWAVDVNWGDGTPDTTFTETTAGSLGTQNHTYGDEGTKSPVVTVTNSSTTFSGSSTFQIAVADAPLTAGTLSISGGVEGVTPTSLSAAFTDANRSAPASDFSGTINWGDGNTTSFNSSSISGTGGSYTLSGSHQYSEEGSYTVSVSVHDVGGATTDIFSAGTLSTFASGLNAPDGLAFDGSGNLYVANIGNGTVSKVDTAGGVTTFASGFVHPEGLAFDSAGNLYVSHGDNAGTIDEVRPNGQVSEFANYTTGLYYPKGLAFDTSGNLYAADLPDGAVTELTPSGVPSTFFAGHILSEPFALAFDSSENLYISDVYTGNVVKVTPAGAYSTYATGFNDPVGLAFDKNGDLYVSDHGTNTVSIVTPAGVVSKFVSSGLDQPQGLAFDSSGNLYISNDGTNTVIKVGEIATAAAITGTATVADAPLTAGTLSISGGVEGVTPTSLSAAFTDANWSAPASDFSGTINWGDGNTTSFNSSSISGTGGSYTLSGSHQYSEEGSYTVSVSVHDVGGATTDIFSAGTLSTFASGLNAPIGLAFDGSGNLYVANIGNGTVSKVDTAGGVTTFASGFVHPEGLAFDSAGNLYVSHGDNAGTIDEVRPNGQVSEFANYTTGLYYPKGLAFDTSGNLYAADLPDGAVAELTPSGVPSTFFAGHILSEPFALAFDSSENLYISDVYTGNVVKVTPAGAYSTYATGFNDPVGLAFDRNGDLFVSDHGNNTVSMVTPAGVVSTFVSTGLDQPQGLAFDSSGNLYISNDGTNTVIKVGEIATAAAITGTATVADAPLTAGTLSISGGVEGVTPTSLSAAFTDANWSAPTSDFSGTINWGDGNTTSFNSSAISGTGGSYTVSSAHQYSEEGSYAVSVSVHDVGGATTDIFSAGTLSTFASGLNAPIGLAFDGSGNLYVANIGNGTVSKVDTAGGVTTFASGFVHPEGLAFDSAGNLYVSHGDNAGTIDEVRPNGQVSEFANYTTGLYYPKGLAFDTSGNLYAADLPDGAVAELTPSGVPSTFFAGHILSEPFALAFDSSENLYISDVYTGNVVKVTPAGAYSTYATGFNDPVGLAFDRNGDLYVSDHGNNTVSMVTPAGVVSTFVSTGLDQPQGLAFDSSGNLYISNDGTNTVIKVGEIATAAAITGTATVADAPLTATATPVTTAVYGTPFSGEIAAFSDANPNATLSDFPLANATIQWGDGNTTNASAITQPGGAGTPFDVFGIYTYGQAGATANPLQVTITDVDGAISNTTSYTPIVGRATLIVTSTSNSKTYGVTASDTGTVGGVVNNDGITASFASAGDTATASVSGSPYLITATLSDPNSKLGNYTVFETDANLTVGSATLIVTSTSNSKTYGVTASDTGTVGGVVNNDGITASFASAGDTATASVSGSPYLITATLSDPNNKLGNYTVLETGANLTVGSATLIVTSTSNSKTYGVTASDTGTVGGVVNNDGITASFASAGDTATASVSGSPYLITATLSDPNNKLGNYTVLETDANLTVSSATLIVTSTSNSKTYGVTASDTGMVGGVVNNDGITASFASAGDTATASVSGSPYLITATLSDPNNKLGNYTVHVTNANLTVGKATLTVTTTANSKTYGVTASDAGTVSGVLNNDGITASFASAGDTATASVSGSPYLITATLSDPNSKLGNYTVLETDAKLTVGRATLIVTSTSNSKTYGVTASDTGTVGGVVNNDGITASFASAGDTATASVSGSPYLITATLSDPNSKLGNYTVLETDAKLTVGSATLIVTSTSNSKTYGVTASDTGTVGGVVNNDGITASFASAGDTATASVSGSPYLITATLSDPNSKLGNYTVHVTNANLTVGMATLTVTATANSKTYGITASDTGTVSGVVNNDGITASFASAGDTATASVSGSPYLITATLSDPNNKLGNYTVHVTNANLTLGKATLTVTATANSKTYGVTASDAGTVSGVLNNDGITASFASAGDTATASVSGSPYLITATLSDPNSKLGNYTVHVTNANLSVSTATPAIVATDASGTYTSNAFTATATATGVASDGTLASATRDSGALSFNYYAGSAVSGSPLGVVPTNPGTYTVVAHYTSDNTNYNNADSSPVTFTITAAGESISGDVFVLNQTASGALTVSGNAHLNVTGTLQVDSNSTGAVNLSGNADVSATQTSIVGGDQVSGNAGFNHTPATHAAYAANPLAVLATPTGGTSYAAVNLSGNGTLTINPGVYPSITISGNAKLILNPGTYIIGSGGVTVSGNATVTGTTAAGGQGVLIYNNGALAVSGNASVNLTASSTGTYAGLAIFQALSNASAVTVSGNANLNLNGSFLYAANVQSVVTISGNAQVEASMVVNELNISGNADES